MGHLLNRISRYRILAIILLIINLILGGKLYARSREVFIPEHNQKSVAENGEIEQALEAVQASDICLSASDNDTSDSLGEELGTFKITAYTAGYESTGKNVGDIAYGITASGETVKEGITIAADWEVLPVGSKVYIQDVGFRWVQDKGGAVKGQHIDLYIDDLGQALEWGVQEKKVWLVSMP